MTYYIYLRTEMTPYVKVEGSFKSLEEVNQYLDNVVDYSVYLVVGYDKDIPTYSNMGRIDKPLAKRLRHK